MKNSTVRITDTLNFIGTTNIVTPAERQDAHQFVTAFINKTYPAANAGQPAYEAFSNTMSLGWHTGNDPNNRRQMKRAAYMLTKALKDHDPASSIAVCNPATIGDAAAETVFKNLLRKARLVSDSLPGHTGGGATAAYNLLNINPLQFLTTNKLIVRGSTKRDTAQGDRNVLPFYFGYELVHDRYVWTWDSKALAGSAPVLCDSVTAMPWTDVPNSWNALPPPTGDFSQIPAIELASPFMVTTQFTGCAFCMKRHNGHVYCAHLGPKHGPTASAARKLTGTALARELAGLNLNVVAGDFANAAGGGPLAIYGAGFSRNTLRDPGGYPAGLGGGSSYMTIIGVQRTTDYHIYSQITQNGHISAAERIF